MRRVIAVSVVAVAVVALATAAIAQRAGSEARVYGQGPERYGSEQHYGPERYGPERPVYGENRHYLPPGNTPGVRWEYATLSFHVVRESWAWKSVNQRIQGNKSQILRALGGQARHNDVSYVDIASQVGLDGWELAAVLERETGTEVWFKRPVR